MKLIVSLLLLACLLPIIFFAKKYPATNLITDLSLLNLGCVIDCWSHPVVRYKVSEQVGTSI